MRSTTINTSNPPGGMSIRELAERTGVSPQTLRSWETRYGLPQPRRLPGGHRRYDDSDVRFIDRVVSERARGLSLPAAIERASAVNHQVERSVFAGLRRRHPSLESHVLHKRTLLALTRAIEDEACARGTHPMLFAGFQRQKFYRQSSFRWAELARTAQSVTVFADFTEVPSAGDRPLQVPVPPDAPMRREWLVICDASDQQACVSAWEQPSSGRPTEAERRFETVWSVDPRAVRDAGRIAAQLTEAFAPSCGQPLIRALADDAPAPSVDLNRAASLLNRMVDYLEQYTTG